MNFSYPQGSNRGPTSSGGATRSVHGRRLPQAPVYQQAQQPHLRPQPQQQYSTQSSSSLPRKSRKPLIFAAMTATIENESTPPSRDHPDHPTSPSEYASPKPQLQAVLPTQPESSSGPNASTSGSASRPIPIPQTQSQIPAAAPISLSASPPLNTHSRLHGPRQIPKSPSPPPNTQMPFTPQTPPRTRKLSKARNQQPSFDMTAGPTPGSSPEQQRNIGKVRPTTPNSKARPTTPISPNTQPVASKPLEPAFQMMEVEPGIAIGDDPFARIEGVTMLGPSPPPSRDGHAGGSVKKQKSLKGSTEDAKSVIGDEERPSTANGNGNASEGEGLQVPVTATVVGAPPTPISPEDVKAARRKERKERKERERLEKERLLSKQNGNDKDKGKSKELFPSHPPMREPITLAAFLADPNMLCSLLSFLSFTDWLLLSSVSREIRVLMVQNPLLREEVLERYLNTDLSDYMRGVSTPTHEYARVANMYVHSLSVHPDHRDPLLYETVRSYTAATRAYTRVVLRLRVQAEKESAAQSVARGRANGNGYSPGSTNGTINGNGYFPPSSSHRATTASRQSSRAPSPARSSFSHSHAGHSGVSLPNTHNSSQTQLPIAKPTAFQSPLFRLRRAPLLRVFVPSPEGDWLSDKSVLECEAECKRAGVLHLLRMGDVVWDVAVGDEGNVGRLIWDGSYLIDLDYTYSPIGDLPKYMPTLAFPPSYFHRVIRTGSTMTNPIVHIDLSPWGEEIATNLQLLQDRVRTETPQGAYHNVVRWVHRSSFMIRPPPRNPQSTRGRPTTPRIPIPETENLFVDPGWYGAIVVETEGTNEALADLQDRCGPGAFPPRARGAHVPMVQIENRKVFRILREKSRPGEIWIKAVSVKERLL
ncbi:hypothetical protein BDQ12DRAFT_701187 [Crucibulum laeve]|uniref:F-box domain-containing protein n=1 Tax=Crucibulum laeve TaxID=68775 RepID=A0A5C3LI99_9AGAR|nr:hypothetical protein BDQ12DRAFT_701187 [Crucibulum laeve]